MVVERLYTGMNELTFFGFAQTVYGYRLYVEACDTPEKANNG